LLGILIHHATGTPYGDFLREKIFAPLGMTATRLISDREIIPNRVSGYELHGGKLMNQEFVSATFNSTADGALYFDVADLEKWDRALTQGSIVSQSSLKQMWTLFPLNDGKTNVGSYGFGWRVHDVNGHRVIEHAGIWQGFTCVISRYVDDRVTVVVLTNLDGWHARPTQIERVVAGLVEPALMPKLQPAISDVRSEIAATLRDLLLKAVAGTDASGSFSPTAGYEASLLADLKSGLPADWEHDPFQLVERMENRGVVVSSYRVGKVGDFRLIMIGTNAAGKIEGIAVFSDPDNR
jgi:hypothetical protein